MDWLLLQPTSIEQIARTLFTGVLACYLLSVRGKSRAAWWLAAAFVVLTVNGMADFMEETVYPSWRIYFFSVQFVAILLVVLALTMFAYEFLENPFPLESKIVLWLNAVCILGYSGFMVYHLLAYGMSMDLMLFVFGMEIIGGLFILWFLLVLLRKTVRLSESANPSTRPSKEPGSSLKARLAGVLTKLVKPQGRSASAHRAFALLFVFLLVNIAANFLEDQGFIAEKLGAYLKFTGMLIFFIGFVVVYINHAPEPTTLPVKLIGFMLMVVLAVLGVLVHETEMAADERCLLYTSDAADE